MSDDLVFVEEEGSIILNRNGRTTDYIEQLLLLIATPVLRSSHGTKFHLTKESVWSAYLARVSPYTVIQKIHEASGDLPASFEDYIKTTERALFGRRPKPSKRRAR